MHRWAIHASSNPFADQNVFSGFDKLNSILVDQGISRPIEDLPPASEPIWAARSRVSRKKLHTPLHTERICHGGLRQRSYPRFLVASLLDLNAVDVECAPQRKERPGRENKGYPGNSAVVIPRLTCRDPAREIKF